MLVPHALLPFWSFELYLECASHIYSVIYVKYVYNAPCCSVDASDIYMHIEYLTYMPLMPKNYIKIITFM